MGNDEVNTYQVISSQNSYLGRCFNQRRQ